MSQSRRETPKYLSFQGLSWKNLTASRQSFNSSSLSLIGSVGPTGTIGFMIANLKAVGKVW